MSDMLIVTERKSSKEMGVFQASLSNQIQTCTAIGDKTLHIQLAGCNMLDCELQNTSERNKWVRLLNEVMASCAVQDVEAGGSKRASVTIVAPSESDGDSMAGERMLYSALETSNDGVGSKLDQLVPCKQLGRASSQPADRVTEETRPPPKLPSFQPSNPGPHTQGAHAAQPSQQQVQRHAPSNFQSHGRQLSLCVKV